MIYLYYQEVDGVWYAVALEKKKIVATAFSFTEKDVLQHLMKNLPYNMSFQAAEKPSWISQRVLKTLKKIYEGNPVSIRFQMDTGHLSSYVTEVLKCMMKIPVGCVATYGAIADVVGGSPRAVGRAAALNPFPLLIPCHRVVKAYGGKKYACSVGGYGIGSEVKLRILRREDKGYRKPLTIKVNNKVLSMHSVSHVKEL